MLGCAVGSGGPDTEPAPDETSLRGHEVASGTSGDSTAGLTPETQEPQAWGVIRELADRRPPLPRVDGIPGGEPEPEPWAPQGSKPTSSDPRPRVIQRDGHKLGAQ